MAGPSVSNTTVDTSTHEFHEAVVEAVDRLQSKSAAGEELGVSEATIRRAVKRASGMNIHRRQKDKPTISDDQVTVVALGDLHNAPEIPRDRFTWIGRYVAEAQPDYLVDIGDSITFDSLCKYDANDTHRGKEKPTIMEDLTSAHEAWSLFDKECPIEGGPIRRKTRGNHEDRLWSFENRTPETWGAFQFEYERLLERHGFEETEYGEMMFIEGVGFVHVPFNEMGKPYGGKTAETRIANDALHDIVFGHSHKARLHRAPKIGTSQFIQILNLGCGLPHGHVEQYAKMSSSGWWWGVHKLIIRDGHIQSVEATTMVDLERRYG